LCRIRGSRGRRDRAHPPIFAGLIERPDVGWTFDYPLEDALVRFFETIGPEQYAAKRDRLSALPTNRFVAGSDVDALCRKLDGLT
jgi:hypothetical protein